MTQDSNYIARLAFQNKIYSSDGASFEDLVNLLLQQYYPNFIKVKPQGAYGDRKNDGYDPDSCTYCQVYGPECLPKSETNATSKLQVDFAGLIEHWEVDGTKVSTFWYVINDKYKGAFPTLGKAINQLAATEHSRNIRLRLSNHLEDMFFELPPQKMQRVVGYIPDPSRAVEFDFTIVDEVVNKILEMPVDHIAEEIPENPDFEKKLVFNELGHKQSALLRAAYYNVSSIEQFFSGRLAYKREELRERFELLYFNGLDKYEGMENASDLIMTHIAAECGAHRSQAYAAAVYILMAYFFEYCDIFEPVS